MDLCSHKQRRGFRDIQNHIVQLSNSLFDFVKCKSRSAAMPKYTRYTRDGTDNRQFLILEHGDEDNAASFGTANSQYKGQRRR